MSTQTLAKPRLITPPVSEPISLEQAQKQLEIVDDAHDADLMLRIQAAREQWEHDTDSYCLTQTLAVDVPHFCDGMRLPGRPIQSITSITYYDGNNTIQTLASSVYALDAAKSAIRLKYGQSWPSTITRFDAVTVTYVVGYTDPSRVPAVYKQAMLLLVGFYFENREMLISAAMQDCVAYENLVRRFMRSTYP